MSSSCSTTSSSPVMINNALYGDGERSVQCKNHQRAIYSRKVFIGGLPQDIDETGILASFTNFGVVAVNWPGKNENPKYMFPPKGFAFLLFEDEISVHRLIEVCKWENGLLHYFVSSPSLKNKVIEIRPWKMDTTFFLKIPYYGLIQNLQYPVFVGGIPRVFTSEDLAQLADNVFGNVSFAAVFVDTVWQYPKGSGFVLFTNLNNYFSALDARYISIDVENYQKEVKAKYVEFKPLVRENVPKRYNSLLMDLHVDFDYVHHHNKLEFHKLCTLSDRYIQ